MFYKRVRRKTAQWSRFLVLSMVVSGGLIFWLISPFKTFTGILTRSELDEGPLTHERQDLSLHFKSESDCPVCTPCDQLSHDSKDILDHAAHNPISINCSVPSKKKRKEIICLQRGDEVYMPVSFINPFFEVYGEIKMNEGWSRYEFRYSYGNMYSIQPVYHPGGVFLNFEYYHVEKRKKILCVSAIEGVPLANQWKEEGYYYAITVAQYGISHHAKALLNGNPTPKILSNGRTGIANWVIDDKGSIIEKAFINIGGQQRDVIYFTGALTVGGNGPKLIIHSVNSSLCLDVFLSGAGRITVKIAKKDGSHGYVHFDDKNRVWDIQRQGHVFYGMGLEKETKWVHLARNIAIDWNKAFAMGKNGLVESQSFDHIVDISLHGTGFLDNLTIAESCHLEHLVQAADWLVTYQDSKGGWATDFEIKTGPIHLNPGWYSAMAQGQAMSTLIRAYNVTGKTHYLDAAVKALYLYTVSSKDGGVKTQFMKHLDWYEEYPTTPYGTFVLNGFIFSLLGLYDVMETVTGEGQILAKKLWDSGLRSLKSMLGMFDSGAGTFYDLRHIVYHDQPNRARWDYHLVHISLIQEMAIVDGDSIFHSTAERWIRYLQGKKSKHN